MNGNMSYGMESYKLIKNDELIKKLKEKDVHFVKFCLGIYGSAKTKKEGRVAIEEDFMFFLSGLHEIKEIIGDLTKRMEESTSEEEKRKLIEELETWKRERNDYYKELAKIERQMEKAHELKENGRNALNEEKSLEYARMIYLITVYDQQKQKIILDGKTDVSELESVVSTLHSIQDKLNLLYQATYQETDLLEEKDVIPRIRMDGETNEDYERYLYQFYHKENLLPKMIVEPKNENLTVEEMSVEPQVEEETVYSDGYENGLTYSLEEQMPKIDFEEPLEYDSYLDHLDTFLTSSFILKTFSYFDERIENFKKMLYYIQKARETTNELEYPYFNLYEGFLSNANYMGELEITNPQEFENEKEILLESLKDYQTEFNQLKIDSKDVEFYNNLSKFFQAIYLYDKKKQDYAKNLDEKENLLTIYHYINEHAKYLFNVDQFIPNTDLPFTYNEQLETENQYTNIFEIPEEDNLTLDDFMTEPPISTAVVPVNKSYDVVSLENEKLVSEKEELEKQFKDLKAENERLLRENEELKSVAKDSQEQIENLTHEKEELQQELEKLKAKKKKGGKPFRIIREKAHDLWEKVNKRNVMYAAIGIVSLAMIGAGAMKWRTDSQKESAMKIETVESPTLANEKIEEMLTMYQKFNDRKEEPVVETPEVVETPVQEVVQESLPEVSQETLYDTYQGPKIGDLVTIGFGANTYTDFLVEKDLNSVNVSTGLQRVFRGNYSPDTEMVVLKVAFMDPSDSSKTVIAHTNEEIKKCVNEGYQVLSAAVSLNTSLSSVADGLYETNSKQVDDNVTFYVSAQNINQEKGLSR